MKVYCVFSLESPQRGDSNEYTQYTIFQYKKENHSKLSKICNYGICSKGPKNEFETAVVNELSVFEPLKFYCIYMCISFLQIGETPFYVALDNKYKKVVICVRGTLSLQDVLTDLKADAEQLPLDPVREDWIGHKVILQANNVEMMDYQHQFIIIIFMI